MSQPLPDLSQPDWTPAIARELERAAAAAARLDARISASSVAELWSARARWKSLATTLQLQGHEIEEIDIFAADMRAFLPNRICPTLDIDIPAELAWLDYEMRNRVGRTSWEGGNEPLANVRDRPALLSALEVAARHARAARTHRGWLALPLILARLGVTNAPRVALVCGDKAWRFSPRDRTAIVARFLRQLRKAADDGMGQLLALERFQAQAAQAIAAELRPGSLRPMLSLCLERPLQTPLGVSQELGLSIAGAGKLLARAARLGLLQEISQRDSWKIYVTADLAVRYGFAALKRGRPPALPASQEPLSNFLKAFDQDVAQIDRLLGSQRRTADNGADCRDETQSDTQI